MNNRRVFVLAKSALKRFGCSINIRGKPCRVMKYSKQAIDSKNNIFIKNLHPTIDNQALYDVFSKYGRINSVKIATNGMNQSLGYGYVQYRDRESALLAVQKTNGKFIRGSVVITEAFRPKKERLSELQSTPFTNVYVKHIPPSWNEQKILKLFGKHGNITSHDIKYTSKGTSACINYESTKQAQTVITKLNQLPFGQYTLFVARAQKKSNRQYALQNLHQRKEHFLFVANIPYFVDDRGFKRIFYKFGNVTSGYIKRMGNGRSKGQGIVGFDNQQSAMDAQFQMNGNFLFGNKLYVVKARNEHEYNKPIRVRYVKKSKVHMAKQVNVVNDNKAALNYDSESSSESLSEFDDNERKITEIEKEDDNNNEKEEEKKNEQIEYIHDELSNWLEKTVKLPQYLSLFIENGVEDLETVRLIKEEDLKDMGMKKFGHIKKMNLYIDKLKQETEEGDVDDKNRFL